MTKLIAWRSGLGSGPSSRIQTKNLEHVNAFDLFLGFRHQMDRLGRPGVPVAVKNPPTAVSGKNSDAFVLAVVECTALQSRIQGTRQVPTQKFVT